MLTACGSGGGDGEENYYAEFEAILRRLGERIEPLRGSEGDAEAEAIARASYRDFGAEIEGLDPPEEAAIAHEDLLSATRGFNELLNRTQREEGAAGEDEFNKLLRFGALISLACRDIVSAAASQGVDLDIPCTRDAD